MHMSLCELVCSEDKLFYIQSVTQALHTGIALNMNTY